MKYLMTLIKIIHLAVKNRMPLIRNYLLQHGIHGDDDTTDDELDAIIAGVIAEYRLKIAKEAIQAKIRQIFDQVNGMNSEEFQAELHDALGIDIFESDPWLDKMRNLWAQQNSQLITNMEDTYTNRVADIVSNAVRNGTSYSDVASQIEDATGVNERRAQLIARDQVSTLNGQLTRARQMEAGISQYKWSTSKDSRVRPLHAAREGIIYSWSDPPRDGNPGEPIHCRCTAIPVIDTDTLVIGGIPKDIIERG